MKLSNIFISLAALGLTVGGLTGCGTGGETIVDGEKYQINIDESNEIVTITTDKSSAAKGEVVIVTVIPEDPTTEIGKVYYDLGKECEKINKFTFKFTMPDHPVTVSVETGAVSGDVVLQGGLNKAFKKEGNLYVARGVKVNDTCDFNVIVNESNGRVKKLSSTDVDRTKTFANIKYSPATGYALRIAGGSTYDFIYDKNSVKSLSVQRTNVDELPYNEDDLQSLFSGEIGSSSSVYPAGLTKVAYSNKLSNEKFEWQTYADNTAYGKVSELEHKADSQYVESEFYANIKGSVFTYVSSFDPFDYVENGETVKRVIRQGYETNHVINKLSPYDSGVYGIAKNKPNGDRTDAGELISSSNYVNPIVAEWLVNTAPITMESFEYDIMPAYRHRVTGSDITLCDILVDSNANTDSGFTTTVSTSKTIDSTADSTHKGPTEQFHSEIRVKLDFTSNGALVTGSFVEKQFGEDKFNFKKNQFITGTPDTNFEREQETYNEINVEFTYGDKEAAAPAFDASKYLVSEIKNLTFHNKAAFEAEPNKLNVGDLVSKYASFDTLPEKPLNVRQYTHFTSTNEEVIGKDFEGKLKALAPGNCDVILGIENDLGVQGRTNVEVVATAKVRSMYFDAAGEGRTLVTKSNETTLYTGHKIAFNVKTSSVFNNETIRFPSDLAGEWVDGVNYGIDFAFDHEHQTFVIDATSAVFEKEAPITLRVTSSLIQGYGVHTDEFIDFVFNVKEGKDKTAFVGKWTCPAFPSDEIVFSLDPSDATLGNYKASYPYAGEIWHNNISYIFAWRYDSKLNNLEAICLGEDTFAYTLDFLFDGGKNQLAVYFAIITNDGNPENDTEEYGWVDNDTTNYDVFTKVQ